MREFLKKAVMDKGMQLLQSEAVTKLMESEKVGIVIEKAMSVPFKVSGAIMSQKERLVALFDLATQEDIDDIKRAITKMEGVLKEIKKESKDLLNKLGEEESTNSKISE